MPTTIQAHCPGCKKVLRVPADWQEQPLRCKHCRKVIQLKGTALIDAPAPAAPVQAKAEGNHRPKTPAPPCAPAAAAAAPATAPVSEPPSSEFGDLIVRHPLPRRRSILGRGGVWIAALVLLGITAGTAAVAWRPLVRVGMHLRDLALSKGTDSENEANEAGSAKPIPGAGDFPRRALAICVHDYVYANPVSYGDPGGENVHTFMRRLASALHIPSSQVAELSDASPSRTANPAQGSRKATAKTDRSANVSEWPAVPPLKTVIEKTVTDFLAGARAQDRILLLFMGHIVVVDDQAYLVPLEGEPTEKPSLIPLTWLYGQLAQCKAQQKVLVVDTCRLDPSRGLERPGSGPMPAKLEALLAQPPAGVQVWSACAAAQYSYELEGQSIFLSRIQEALSPEQFKKVEQPDDPLPLDLLAPAVLKNTTSEAESKLKSKQTPRLLGSAGTETVTYDRFETLPPRLELPRPKPGAAANHREIHAIFEEIAIPPLKPLAADSAATPLEDLLPFDAKRVVAYQADGTSLAAVEAEPAKYPLRAAVLAALKLLRKEFDPKNPAVSLRETFSGSATEPVKKQIEAEQAKPAMLRLKLSDLLDDLRKAGKERDQEPSARWQAHYDYVLAQVLLRLAYVDEYNMMLAKIRKDELPTLEPGQTGYRLAAVEKMRSPKETKDLAAESRKLLTKIIKDHRGTPWEVLAKRARLTALGLEWQPTR